jgi:hypothetical protein
MECKKSKILERSDIVCIVHVTRNKSFACVEKNKRASVTRRLDPLKLYPVGPSIIAINKVQGEINCRVV